VGLGQFCRLNQPKRPFFKTRAYNKSGGFPINPNDGSRDPLVSNRPIILSSSHLCLHRPNNELHGAPLNLRGVESRDTSITSLKKLDAKSSRKNSTPSQVELLLLVTSCVVMMVFSIWPLLTKKINPDYAAKMLEDAKPGFRNSLLNYVWFRKKPEVIGGAVFDAVARQAAVDLHSVPDESTVDRSKVIRLGFWLIGVTAAMIAYFMLSPKNPLQTFNRVM